MKTQRTGNGIYVLGNRIAMVRRTDDGITVWECERHSRCRVKRVRALQSFKTVPAAVAWTHQWLEENAR